MKNSLNAKKFWMFWDKFGVFVIFVFVALVFALIDPRVLQPTQLVSVLNRSSWTAIAAIGMTFAICSGGFDLSIGSLMSLCGCLVAKFIMDNGFSTEVAILLTVGIAALCGLLNGLLITKLKIVPFVATLGTQLVFDGITQVYTNNIGTFIKTEQYAKLAVLGRGTVLGIPVKLLVVALIFVLALILYRNTKLGVKIRAVGSNEAAARTSGINADNTLIIVYIITAVTAALAAIMYTATVQSASPDAGVGFESDAITAVILGGTALSGGKGNLIGALVGAVLIAFVKMCLNFLGAPEAMHVIVTGAVLVLALSISGIRLITQREEK